MSVKVVCLGFGYFIRVSFTSNTLYKMSSVVNHLSYRYRQSLVYIIPRPQYRRKKTLSMIGPPGPFSGADMMVVTVTTSDGFKLSYYT